MTTSQRRFSGQELETLQKLKILGVRSGTEHRHTGVWVVVVERRVFVRSWNDKPTGWFRAFRDEPRGTISLGTEERAVRASHVRSERLRRAVSQAYALKYDTKASEKWVRGFAEKEREATTLELVPDSPRSARAASRRSSSTKRS
ncbi:MAG TPA: DUF2255 family protein [Gemmatimonadaceae bacterium]|jgi:Uncharacterized protein conserved in bacteria (DUF2255).